VPDPIGSSREVYLHCAATIKNALPSVLAFVEQTEVPTPAMSRGGGSSSYPMADLSSHAGTSGSSAGAQAGGGLRKTDPEIFDTIQAEEKRQREGIELIASENFTSRAVMEAQGSCLTNKYAEGYPGKRWYGGCENVDVVEQLAIDRAKRLFGAEHANVQAHSGAQANMAVYYAAIKHGDRILTMNLAHGGHLTHGHPANFSASFTRSRTTAWMKKPSRSTTTRSDKLGRGNKPAMITGRRLGRIRASSIIRACGRIADAVGALLFIDMAHVGGLGGRGDQHPSPDPHAHFVTRPRTKPCAVRAAVSCCAKNASRRQSTRCYSRAFKAGR
jgi:glycine hydroxymethyltransferase